MRKQLLLTILSVMVTAAVFSQGGYWSVNNDNRAAIATDKAVARLTYPKEFKLFNLDAAPLRQQLFSIVDKQANRSTIITIPNAAGSLEQFEVFEASNFDPELQARFPEIRAYSGRGITDKFATLKLSISPQGLQTMVFRSGMANEFIEPYSQDHTVYSVYNSKRDKGQLPWTCSTEDRQISNGINSTLNPELLATGASSGTIKTMRLAQSCNAEYSNFFGATSSAQVGLVLAAYNATLTRCNGVYEKDLALHLNLIANTTAVIYYNPATDPYSTNLSSWNNQLQSTLTSVIGEANYDIGHMFGASGGGGNAGCIGCVCVNGSKGSGITSPADGIPQGDNFDIDYVAHEVGHQLGGNHTFSMSSEGTGVNKEVGSGITVMGYAGITSYDVAPHSIDIFHQASIAQIQANLATKSCPITTVMTANHAPVLSAVSNYTIPISTPFALTAAATDQENDPLTYNWEQNDNSTTTGASSVASPTKTTGPNWISFPSTASGTRTFPRMQTILAGLNVTPTLGGDAAANTEALSSVSRTLNFRVTVRDNKPYVEGSTIGQTAFTDAVVTVTNTSGPFSVTSPNTNITWAAGGSATVTWNVNNTTSAPVSCANVNILISSDGGNTFSMLLANTPNDGSQSVSVPNTPGTTNRIKVEAVGNIFFDISNTNFTIGAAAACGDATGLNTTAITTNSATVNWSAVASAISYDVDYKAASSGTWISAATNTTSLSVNLSGLSASTLYDWRVRADCSGGSGNYVQAQFTTTATGGACPGTYHIESNGTTGTANPIPMNTDIKGTLGFSGDNDYYSFVAAAGSITISLTTLPANYQLALLNSAGTTLQSSTNNGTANESITRTVTAGTYFVRVYPRNNGAWNATSCYTLRVNGSAGRTTEGRWITSNNNISLFPNPAKNTLNVSLEDLQSTATLQVFDIMGKMVMQQQTSRNVTQLNVSKLPSGVYMLNIKEESSVRSVKFVKE
jgi:Metallo-peptidase family M12B Reprolysin-like/Secretion system C-terminal sorting domain/Bacterial pre-peptidase C-terminal domain/Fibronectin type III domain